MLVVMIDALAGLDRRIDLRPVAEFIGVPRKAGKIAGANVEAKPMAGSDHPFLVPEVDSQFYPFSR